MHGAPVEVGLLILALGLGGRLAERLSVSPVPVYLAIGVIAGRTELAESSRQFIELSGQIGALLLLFMLGVEYTLDELLQSARRTLRAGTVDLLLNLAPGLLVGWALGWSFAATFLLAGVTYISSSGIAAKLLHDLGWVGNRETPLVLSILVFEDLAMAAYLAAASALLLGGGLTTLIGAVGISLAAVAALIVVLARLSERVSTAVFARTDEATLLTLLGGALTVAAVAEMAHVSAAVAAFLFGLGVSGEAAHRAESILAPVRDLFAAVFFALFGMAADITAIPDVALPAVVLVLLGLVSKAATARLAARSSGVGRLGQLRMTALLVSRGEFSILIAEIGALGGLGEPIRPLAMAVVMVWAVVGPVLARWLATRELGDVAPVSR